jgi:protein SCO1/2
MRALAVAAMLAACVPGGPGPLQQSAAAASTLTLAPPLLAFDQRLGQPVPLDRTFHDMSGAPVELGRYFGTRPVILVLGYYHCPMLCSTVMDGILESLRGIGVDYDVVAVSIDPAETSADAARKYEAYRGLLEPGREQRLHLLTGQADAIQSLAAAAGFPYHRDPATGQFGHPAGFLVVTPQGKISRYFPGIRFEPRDVRLALVEASSGHIGSLADRLVLLCSHYDPQRGQYNVAVMQLARGVGGATMLGLLGVILVTRRRRRA